MLPSIEPSEVGLTGLLWLFLSYGFVLYKASDLISEGSELLLLVPSMAGLVGGVVLPLLGAVPDGAIILFSGLGDLETAQDTLSVGVGALAGSTIMLLTVPFALSIYGGRVDLVGPNKDIPNYLGKPKLSEKSSRWGDLTGSGVTLSDAVSQGGWLMIGTLIPYFLIQVPAIFIKRAQGNVAAGEHWWSLSGLIVCVSGLILYMHLQLKMSRDGQDRDKRMAVMKKVLKKGAMSLSGAIAEAMLFEEKKLTNSSSAVSEYQSLDHDPRYPPPAIAEYLKEVLADAFRSYDYNGDGELDKHETQVFFRDFHEAISEEEMDELFRTYDNNNNGVISLDEFIGLAYSLIKAQERKNSHGALSHRFATSDAIADTAFAEVEHEDVPEEFTDLTPDEQQAAIKFRALWMCLVGAVLVVLFSDPMVDVMQEIAVRTNVPPFYVSFILAPLASNASEVIASMYYASKKTGKTITVSLTTLEGAACMNNTFCLSIFMALIFFRGLAWQYTAETLAIVIVEIVIAIMVQKNYMTVLGGLAVFMLFPLSLVLVASLEAIGFD